MAALAQGAQLESQVGNRKPLLARSLEPLPLRIGVERSKQNVMTPGQLVIT